MSNQETYMFTLDGTDPEVYKVMSQKGVHHVFAKEVAGDINCCWDGIISPKGEFYFSLGSENGKGDFAYLNRFDYKNKKIEYLLHTSDVLLPPHRAMPGSKLHTSIDFLPDGRLIFVNHNTDGAPGHPEWMPYAYFSHKYESFPGSSLFIYDPETGKTEVLGTPVPHESIYGAVYDTKHNAYYMLGFFLGHIYKYDLTTREVKDLGKAVEHCSHRIHLGPDGNVYGSTKGGYFFRVNTDTDKLEYLGIRFPESKTNSYHNVWYRYVTDFYDLDDHTMLLVLGWADDVYEYDTNTNTLTAFSRRIPADHLFKETPGQLTSFNTGIDKDGVLWYIITSRCVENPTMEYVLPNLLFRWDYRNPDAKPECLGVVGTVDYGMFICSTVQIDKEGDILYATECTNNVDGPMVTVIDLKEFRKHCHERSGILKSSIGYPKPLPPDAKAFIEEAMSVDNAHEAFPTTDVFPVRIWPEFPGLETASSAVIGLCFADNDTLWALTGDGKPQYAVKIEKGAYVSHTPLGELEEGFKDWLLEQCMPKTHEAIPDLPYAAGRQYLAKPNAIADWNGGRQIVGTKDGLVAIVNGEDVFALGQAAPLGPVRALCTNKAKTMLWGTVGDKDEFGRVFTYDDRRGLRQRGFFRWSVRSENGMIVGADILSSLALSPDEKWLAIGAQDRLGTVLLIRLNDTK